MKATDHLYLLHIRDAMAQVGIYIQGHDYASFIETRLVQDGVIRQLEIMGEATKNLSLQLRQAFPDIPWQDIAGMRDMLIHQYFGADLDVVWVSATEDIPHLKPLIDSILKQTKALDF